MGGVDVWYAEVNLKQLSSSKKHSLFVPEDAESALFRKSRAHRLADRSSFSGVGGMKIQGEEDADLQVLRAERKKSPASLGNRT